MTGGTVAFRLADTLRPDASATMTLLRARGLGLSVLSGDRSGAVRGAAEAVAIPDWQAEVKPAEKIAALRTRGEKHRILMVGDGLNDAPALAQAHVSMSPANAADITQRAADLVFQGDRIAPVAEAIAIAVQARAMALQNFAVALAYNAVCVPLAMMGHVTPLVAAIAMSTSSILVTANALRLGVSGRSEKR